MSIEALKEPSTVESWDTFDGHSPMVHYINQLYPINKFATDYINKRTFRRDIKKGKHLVKSGELCQDIYFIQKGVMRGYIKEGRKEITTWITGENSLVASIKGFYLQKPSIKNIQAIQDCELIGAHYEDLEFLYENYVEMNTIGRKILENYYIASEERAFISRLPRADARYNRFLETNIALANRIQLKYIASFLGITVETLSRIRSKQAKGKN